MEGRLVVMLGVALAFAVLLPAINGQSSTGGVTFQNCETLKPTKNIYWNLDRAAGVVTYALEDKIPDGSWSAFGYNKQGEAHMLPADVVITTASSALDYDLSDKNVCVGTKGVCADTGLFGTNDVKRISAVRANGVSKITFSKAIKTGDSLDVDLSSSLDQPVQAIFASGPLSSTGGPIFHDPAVNGAYVYDVTKITLGRTPALNCVPLLSDSAVTGSSNSTAANTTAEAPASPATPVPPLPAGTPGCSIAFQGVAHSFAVCREEAAGMTYRWNNLGGNKVEVAVSCDHDGWCGLGFGPKMVGSSAIVAFPGGPSGVYISNYLLGGQDEDEVLANSGTLGTGPLAAEYSGGILTMLFNLTLATPAQYPVSPIVVGKGSEGNPSTGRIPEHDTFFQGSIHWEQGTVDLQLHRGITTVHGVLMVIVWVFFFPAGVLAARYLRHLDPLWWHLHRIFQGLGFLVFLIAIGLSLKAKAINGNLSTPHKILGVALLVAVCLQVLAVFVRAKKTSKLRFAWNLYHHWLGRSALLLSIVNIYLGISLYAGGAAFAAIYTVLWVLVLLIYVAVELWWRFRGPWSRVHKQSDTLPHVRPSSQELNGRGPSFSEQNEGQRF